MKKMKTLIFTVLQENRGKRRIWFQGQSLAEAGIQIGDRYDREEGTGELILILNPEGKRKVSRKKSGGMSVPLIDIENDKLKEIFPFEVGTQLRITILNGKIIIRLHPDVAAKLEREKRLKERLKRSSPLSFALFLEESAKLTTSLNEGLRKAGRSSYVQLGAETSINAFKSHFIQADRLWNEKSKLCRSLDSLLGALNSNPEPVDMLYAGDPSLYVNDDAQVSAFFFKLRAIEALNPAVVMFETDENNASAPLMTVANQILNQLGYSMQHQTVPVDGKQRLVVLGISEGIAHHDWTQLIEVPTSSLASVNENLGRKAVTFLEKHDEGSFVAQRQAQRCESLIYSLQCNERLAGLSLFHGGGVLARAMHKGFTSAGVNTGVAVGVELEPNYLSSSLINNRAVWNDDSFLIQGSIHCVRPSMNSPQCHVAELGIPCTGASRAGISKNKLANPEEHSAAGSMFYWALRNWEASNPAIGLVENVCEYSTTASMAVIRDTLSVLGYRLQETTLSGADYGALENRTRMCFVAISEALPDTFSLDNVVPIRKKESCLGEVLEDIPLDDPMYKPYDYLAKKEAADIAAGKGFRRQLLTAEATQVGCLGKGYKKGRSTEPFFIHPENPDLSRLLTLIEHARVKTVPEELVAGLTETLGHEILGQSIVFCAFEAVAFTLGQYLSAIRESRPSYNVVSPDTDFQLLDRAA